MDQQLPPALLSAAKEYLRDCKLRNFKPPTISHHSGRLQRFFTWLSEHYPGICTPAEITREALTDYQMELYKAISAKGGRLSVDAQHRGMGVVLAWLCWMLEQEKILVNPGATIQLPHEPARLPRNYLSIREMRKLLSVPDLKTHLGVRNRAALEVFYSTGIRAGELQNLKLDHLNLEEGWLTVVYGKGGKDRVVPLGKAAVHFLTEYIEKTRPKLLSGKDHPNVFVGRYGAPVSHDAVNRLVWSAAKEAGIKRRITPHVLRHTCATLLLRGKADIRYIQELLGHKSLSSTQVYTRVEISDLKKVHAKCHPREQEPLDSRK